jgi:hypothetical protein
MEQGCVKLQKWNIQSVATLIFASLAFAMLFFSPFGPISSRFIPFHPMGWAGIFLFLAMLTYFSQRYQESKDVFWFILVLVFSLTSFLTCTSFPYQKSSDLA